jgi:hypothetical protein
MWYGIIWYRFNKKKVAEDEYYQHRYGFDKNKESTDKQDNKPANENMLSSPPPAVLTPTSEDTDSGLKKRGRPKKK